MNAYNLSLNHYDLEGLAKSLKLTSIDFIKTPSVDIESHWFKSPGPADMYFWKAQDKIIKHQVSLYGQVVEWNEFDGVKTGFVKDDEENYGSDIIVFDKEINEVVIGQVVAFIEQIKIIDGEVKKQMVSHYEFYNRWSKLPLFVFFSRLFKPFRKKS